MNHQSWIAAALILCSCTGEAEITEEEIRASAIDASDVLLVANELQLAMLFALADPELLETVPLRNGLTGAQCELLQSKTFGKCPSYSLTCDSSNAIQGVELSWNTGGCGECRKAGRELEGVVSFSRNGAGSYTVVFENYRHGRVTIDGTVSLEITNGAGEAALLITTGEQPLLVTAAKTFEVTLAPFSASVDRAQSNPWTIALQAGVKVQGRPFDFAVATKNKAGAEAPLTFSGPLEACLGPTGGSLQVGLEIRRTTVFVVADFGAPPISASVCSRPEVEVGTSREAVEGSSLAMIAAQSKQMLEASAEDVAGAELAGAEAIESTAHSTLLRALRALAQLADAGDIRRVLSEGWSALACGETVELACASGSGSTTVACSGRAVRAISASLSRCELEGVVYDGAFELARDAASALPAGEAVFSNFKMDTDILSGRLSFAQLSAMPLEVKVESAGEGFQFAAGGDAACAYTTRFDIFRIVRAGDHTEIEFKGERETNEGIYGLETIESSGRHATWARPIACTCPRAGSTVDVSSPDLLGLAGGQSKLRISYGPPSASNCATAQVEFIEWPGLPSKKDGAVAVLQPLLEALCVAP